MYLSQGSTPQCSTRSRKLRASSSSFSVRAAADLLQELNGLLQGAWGVRTASKNNVLNAKEHSTPTEIFYP